MSSERFAGSVALAGHFDPATISRLVATRVPDRVANLRSAPGVPIHSLAGALAAQGIKTTVLGGIRGTESFFVDANPMSLAIYPKRGGWAFLLNGLRREREQLLALLRNIQPSIVHAHWTLEAGRAVGDWAGPKVLTVHDAAWEYARLGTGLHPLAVSYGGRWLWNTSETLQCYRHVIAVSPFIETYLRLRHRFRGEIRVIPNIIPDLPADILPAPPFPKSGVVTFGCYGEPGGIKNVGVAVEAFQAVRDRLPEARLLVFGAGWERQKHRFQSDFVVFRGALPHHEFLRALVREVDVWVHPARIEAHPISVCEAIQAGCPVIAGGDSGGVAWTLDYGRAGILVNVRDPGAIGRAMCMAAMDRDRAAEIVRYGQEFVRTQFNQERVLDLHLRYYQDIING